MATAVHDAGVFQSAMKILRELLGCADSFALWPTHIKLRPVRISWFQLKSKEAAVRGEHPSGNCCRMWHLVVMNILLLLVVLLLLFGGGGFYFGGPVIGGGGIGLILLICLVVFLMGGFRARN